MSMLMLIRRKCVTFWNSRWEEKLQKLAAYSKEYLFLQPLVLFFLPLAIAFVGACGLLNVKIYKWRSSRIGHQALDLELLLRKQAQSASFHRQIFITENPANSHFLKMAKRKVWIVNSSFAIRMFQQLRGLMPRSNILCDVPSHGHPHQIFNSVPHQLHFIQADEKKGQELLATLKIPKSDPFVCINARDSSYLKTIDPNFNFSYHDYRDCSIENYIPAAEDLAQSGMWVLRMGAIVSHPLKTENPRILDYAIQQRSDFGDVYLVAHCKFFLGTTSGLANLANCFDVPCVWANMVPLGQAGLRAPDLFIPKKHWSKKLNRLLTFQEIIEMGADRWALAEQFRKADVELIENTPQEIKAVALEMNARLDGTWVPDPIDDEFQECYRKLWGDKHLISGYYSRMGAEFLRAHAHLLSQTL